MPDSPTVGELFKANAVTDEQVNAAVDAYLAVLSASAYLIANGYTLDLPESMTRHPWAADVATDPATSAGLKRAAAYAAIMLTRAQKL